MTDYSKHNDKVAAVFCQTAEEEAEDYNLQYDEIEKICDACDIHFNFDEYCPKCGYTEEKQ